MRIPALSRVVGRFKLPLRDPNRFLSRVSGVIHIGANVGQEREIYSRYGLRVVWIEPVPEIFKTLSTNIMEFSNQRAFQYLVTDQSDATYRFHIANNCGASSSILDLKLHKDVWPQVVFDRSITLRSVTLTSFLEKEKLDIADYDALVMDTQGAELLILRGALQIVDRFNYIKVEVPDFEAYSNCCQLSDLNSFMTDHGFKEFSRNRFARHPDGGSYYDIIYKRIDRR